MNFGETVDRRCGVDDGNLKDSLSEDAELWSPRDWCLGLKHIPRVAKEDWVIEAALHRNRYFRNFQRFLCAVHILLIDQ